MEKLGSSSRIYFKKSYKVMKERGVHLVQLE